jgi:hypothetical protein
VTATVMMLTASDSCVYYCRKRANLFYPSDNCVITLACNVL